MPPKHSARHPTNGKHSGETILMRGSTRAKLNEMAPGMGQEMNRGQPQGRRNRRMAMDSGEGNMDPTGRFLWWCLMDFGDFRSGWFQWQFGKVCRSAEMKVANVVRSC